PGCAMSGSKQKPVIRADGFVGRVPSGLGWGVAGSFPRWRDPLPQPLPTRGRGAGAANQSGHSKFLQRRSSMRPALLALLAFAAALLAQPARAADALRLALQATGTTVWEMAVVSSLHLDKEAGLDLKITELASTEAGKIALQGGSADIIVSD